MSMHSRLIEYLQWSNQQPFVWGQMDCMMDVGLWVLFATDKDVVEEWRGVYSTQTECRDALKVVGGFVPAMKACAWRHGLEEVKDPGEGDVGVLSTQPWPMGGIRMASGKWRVRMLDKEIAYIQPEVIVAWRVKCLH